MANFDLRKGLYFYERIYMLWKILLKTLALCVPIGLSVIFFPKFPPMEKNFWIYGLCGAVDCISLTWIIYLWKGVFRKPKLLRNKF